MPPTWFPTCPGSLLHPGTRPASGLPATPGWGERHPLPTRSVSILSWQAEDRVHSPLAQLPASLSPHSRVLTAPTLKRGACVGVISWWVWQPRLPYELGTTFALPLWKNFLTSDFSSLSQRAP